MSLGLLYEVRKFAETEVLLVVSPYWERGEFSFERAIPSGVAAGRLG